MSTETKGKTPAARTNAFKRAIRATLTEAGIHEAHMVSGGASIQITPVDPADVARVAEVTGGTAAGRFVFVRNES